MNKKYKVFINVLILLTIIANIFIIIYRSQQKEEYSSIVNMGLIALMTFIFQKSKKELNRLMILAVTALLYISALGIVNFIHPLSNILAIILLAPCAVWAIYINSTAYKNVKKVLKKNK